MIEYARLITKSSEGPPTIPPSASHDNGDWSSNDIYEHELYMDSLTGYTYTRQGDTIVLLSTGEGFSKWIEIDVLNKGADPLPKMSVCYFKTSSSSANTPEVLLADNSSEATSSKTMGLLKDTIAPNETGKLILVGEYNAFDTSAYNVGDRLWLGTLGGIVTTPPVAPRHAVFLGIVSRSHHTQGRICVSIQNGFELDELHNVSITTPVTNQGLFYNSVTGLWENKTVASAIGYTPVPETRTLTINGVTQDLSANRTFTISTGITIGSTAIASGVVGRVLFEGAGNVVQESSSLFWDNTGGNLSLGTSIPSSYANLTTLTINGTNGSVIDFKSGNTLYGEIYCLVNEIRFDAIGTNGILKFLTNSIEKMRVAPTTGNVLIGTTTDAGFRLDVNGTARVQGNTTIGINSNTALITSVRNSNSGSSSSTEIAIGNDSSAFIGSLATFSSTFSTPFVRNSICLVSYAYDVLIGTNINVASGGANVIKFATGGSNAAQERMRIFSTGNIGINTTTDAGFRLDVNGTARVQGNFNQSGLFFGMSVTGYWTINNTGNSTVFGSYISQQGMSYFSSQPFCFNVASGAHATSASVQIDSTTKGFLPPRQTQAQRTAIASPAVGLIVYQTDLVEGLYIYKSTGWQFIA